MRLPIIANMEDVSTLLNSPPKADSCKAGFNRVNPSREAKAKLLPKQEFSLK